MNDTTAESETLGLADAARALGVTVQVALSLIQRQELGAARVAGKWRIGVGALDTYRRRLALRDAFTWDGVPAVAARLLRARAAASLEARALKAEAVAARTAGDFPRALALEELLGIVSTATVTFDASSGRWVAAFTRPLPYLSDNATVPA